LASAQFESVANLSDVLRLFFFFFCFFFQAEDGIRDRNVTGVQTCALPIYTIQPYSPKAGTGLSSHELNQPGTYQDVTDTTVVAQFKAIADTLPRRLKNISRSEERRVGKECRFRWWWYQKKRKRYITHE